MQTPDNAKTNIIGAQHWEPAFRDDRISDPRYVQHVETLLRRKILNHMERLFDGRRYVIQLAPVTRREEPGEASLPPQVIWSTEGFIFLYDWKEAEVGEHVAAGQDDESVLDRYLSRPVKEETIATLTHNYEERTFRLVRLHEWQAWRRES